MILAAATTETAKHAAEVANGHMWIGGAVVIFVAMILLDYPSRKHGIAGLLGLFVVGVAIDVIAPGTIAASK